jgi:hypothetical protein
MALAYSVAFLRPVAVTFTVTNVVPGTTQSVSYADLAAAVLSASGDPNLAIYRALTASYANRDAALSALYGQVVENFFLPLPAEQAGLLLGAGGLDITTPDGVIAQTELSLYCFGQAAFLSAGGQSAYFTVTSEGLVPVSNVAELIPHPSPIKSALTRLAACTSNQEMLPIIRETHIYGAPGPTAEAPALFYGPHLPTPSAGARYGDDVRKVPVTGYDFARPITQSEYGVCDFAFVVPHSIIQ